MSDPYPIPTVTPQPTPAQPYPGYVPSVVVYSGQPQAATHYAPAGNWLLVIGMLVILVAMLTSDGDDKW